VNIPARVTVNINDPEFITQLAALEPDQLKAFFAMLRKLLKLDWHAIYRDAGLNWEYIRDSERLHGERLYSIRITKKFRAVVKRTGDTVHFIIVVPDHDSAYE
jgi:hypothetical protein